MYNVENGERDQADECVQVEKAICERAEGIKIDECVQVEVDIDGLDCMCEDWCCRLRGMDEKKTDG